MPRPVKVIVLYASSLSGSLATVYDIKTSVTRLRFADDNVAGQRMRSRWVRLQALRLL
jgi:hypothetical protein